MKQFKTNISILAFFLVSTAAFTGCNDDNDVTAPPQPNEEELITTVELTYTNTANSSEISTFKFADTDGEGGNAPSETDTIRLAANTTYTVAVRFLDESGTDVEDITTEVLEEAAEHLVCYTATAGTAVTITDQDGNGLDLGLAADVTTTSASNGTFTISLKHQPGIKNGSCDVGETDVEVAFVLEVK